MDETATSQSLVDFLDLQARLSITSERSNYQSQAVLRAQSLKALRAHRHFSSVNLRALKRFFDRLCGVHADIVSINTDLHDCVARGDYGASYDALTQALITLRGEHATLRAEVKALWGSKDLTVKLAGQAMS